MTDNTTHRLLTAGMLAGPIAFTMDVLQAWLRPGFDWQRHGSSQLALGDWGWIQSLNFVVAGLLMICFALGARRALREGVGRVWVPILIGVFAVCHVLVGVFSTDPAFGFPPGPNTPQGVPAYADASFHAIIHSASAGIGFNALAVACCILAWRFGRAQTGWMLLSLLPLAVTIAITANSAIWEAHHSGPERATAQFDFRTMWATLPVVWGYLTALAWKLRSSP